MTQAASCHMIISSFPESYCTRSPSSSLYRCRASPSYSPCLVLLALQNSLIYHGKQLWENQLGQNRVQQLRYPWMWREGRISQRSAGLNAAAWGWQNRNKRLMGSWGHVLNWWLEEGWGEGWETQAVFFLPSFFFSLCLAMKAVFFL